MRHSESKSGSENNSGSSEEGGGASELHGGASNLGGIRTIDLVTNGVSSLVELDIVGGVFHDLEAGAVEISVGGEGADESLESKSGGSVVSDLAGGGESGGGSGENSRGLSSSESVGISCSSTGVHSAKGDTVLGGF